MPVLQCAENECHFLKVWGHNGLCHRRVAEGRQNVKPKIYLDPSEQVRKLGLFKTLCMKNHIVNVFLIQINENIEAESVTYGKFFVWLELCFLMATVVGPSRDAFSDEICDE